MKIAVVTPIPTPYRDPFWNAVADLPDVELSVYYCCAGKRDRPWDVDWPVRFNAAMLPGRNLAKFRGHDASCYWNPTITGRLRGGKYDAIVVVGYNHPTMWAAIRFAHASHTPFYLMSESHLHVRRSAWRQQVKSIPLRWVSANMSGGFPTGILAERYLVHYGADPRSLTRIPNVPGVEALNLAAAKLRPTRSALRADRGINDRPTILFVGRLIPKKRADLLIRAFSRVCSDTNAQLVIVGDGTERQNLGQLVDQAGVTKSVRFMGFAPPHEMSQWYAMADLFVLPSSETWGVAVLEALASGLPVIVANEVGSHPDVVTDPAVGDVVPARDEEALAAAMQSRLAQPTHPRTVERAWHSVNQSLRYEVLAKRFVERLAFASTEQKTKAA